MVDFITIRKKKTPGRKNSWDIFPVFRVRPSKDLMTRGHAFYAVWDEENNIWSKDEDDVRRLVDEMIWKYYEENKNDDCEWNLKTLDDFDSHQWEVWQRYVKSLPDRYTELDTKVIFSNSEIHKEDYVSRHLDYPLEDGEPKVYNEMMDVLYSPSERQKLEWAIGAVFRGDSTWIQKFIVLYGGPGTGKSTVLNIIQELFDGYYSVFNSKKLGSSSAQFSLESFISNPLVAIQHDGDLSKIEDNTRLNSIVSHEIMTVEEKYKTAYPMKFRTFIFMGTNKPVKITDAKSGIMRRLIDVSPTGEKIPYEKYEQMISQIHFELGKIANHCIKVYDKLGDSFYSNYIPKSMMGITNDFYNFIVDNYDFFAVENSEEMPLSTAWRRYNEYVQEANMSYPFSKRIFKDELKNYYKEFREHTNYGWNIYYGFRSEMFDDDRELKKDILEMGEGWLKFDRSVSLFDSQFSSCPAQYATQDGTPVTKWENVNRTLSDILTTRLHYVRVPENLIVIDFDIKDSEGNKDPEANLKAAEKWPMTYAEFSKSQAGIHLHYYYNGDVSRLSRIFDKDIEVKVFTGNSSLRRMLTRCNDIPIATISSGLPLKEEKPVLNDIQIRSEKSLRHQIIRNLKKEIHPYTKPSIDMIYKILEDAYNSDLKYDVTDMRPDIQQFALSSTHQALNCLKIVNKMHFCSEESSDNRDDGYSDDPIVFFDVEVFKNLFIVCWKKAGKENKCQGMINPKPEDIEQIVKMKLVGFNNRRYDNHILYAKMMGYTEKQLFQLSQRIIDGEDRSALFNEAYNLSYTDIYNFLAAGRKMSLKKWEIKLGIHHQELGLPWDQAVPETRWKKVMEYCYNDVIATEAVWDANQADWKAREILADLAGLTVNDTTNQCTTKIIVGNDRNPQAQFVYTDLSKIFPGYRYDSFGIPKEEYKQGAKIVSGKSIYLGEDPGEGGRVYANPGIWYNVALLDIQSMHPNSLIQLNAFGDKYTARFKEIVQARIFIKHGDYEDAKKILDGKLAKYLDDPEQAKSLAEALKTAINSVYGLTSAKFPNKLKDPRNIDNIVAKRGALFMMNLQYEVEKRGYSVVHIKTDSIKIADADDGIIQFCMDYAKKYGYIFEHEATYSKMCLVNEAVYIAKYSEPHKDKVTGNDIWWTATGAQFQVPYVFKTLFSHEPVTFEDLCETKSVSTALYLDMNENLPEGDHDYHFIGKVGQFTPILPGRGGGVLLREGRNKFDAVAGTKKVGKVAAGEPDIYYWLESEVVRQLNKQDDVDRSYYNQMVDEAIETISKYGDFEQFVA